MAKSFSSLKNCYDLTDRLDFGKYHGAEIRSLIIIAPDYFKWLLDNVDTFFVSGVAMEFYEQRKPAKLEKFTKPFSKDIMAFEKTFQKHHNYSYDDWNDDIPF